MQLPGRRYPVLQTLAGTAVAAAVGARLGLRGAELRSGVRLGLRSGTVVAAAIATSTAIPVVRAGMLARDLPQPAWKWLLVDIPLGTVWPEETLYRGALGTLAADVFGPRLGRLLQAAVFGLSHIPDARDTGEPVVLTVVATGAAGWVFGWLATHSGSLVAPALTHLAINEAGAVAALLVQRGF
ncbi:MAG: CPBP family intramembrane glutamic endopeptidase [Mycobacterium sp.]